MEPVRIQIPFGRRGVDHLSAIFEEPQAPSRGSACLLAHGAGLHMESPFMEVVAGGLVARGFPVLRFNYPYREKALAAGKRMLPPDPRETLEEAHALALAELEGRAPGRRLLLVGKSLGGRIGSLLAAQGSPCAGLVLFGFPLHPRWHPERPRSEHFAAIAQPALFLQGTCDELCKLDLLADALRSFGGTATVEILEGADHGFRIARRKPAEVFEELLGMIDRWERRTWPD